jgi:hypothetical protein
MAISKILLALVALYICSIKVHAQIHDFDSLVKYSDGFRQFAQTYSDTSDLFNDNEILKVTFESDFKSLVKNKFKDEYQDAVFRIMINDTVQVSRKIQIRPRGHNRKSTCHIPPIRLNFPKKDAYIDQLKQFDKLKMVLDCKQNDLFEQYLLGEYYAYRIYNLINDYSYRVRLLQVTYIDWGNKNKVNTRYAFIIESLEQLAERHRAIPIEAKGTRDVRTNLKILAEVYLFQYLIGNTDWSIPNMHNIHLLKSMDSVMVAPYAIPYDFDFAGIINTIYAVPDEQLGTKTVRERVYRGVCMPEQELLNARTKILGKKAQIYGLYQNNNLLNRSTQQSAVSYLDEFFNITENEKLFRRYIFEACR